MGRFASSSVWSRNALGPFFPGCLAFVVLVASLSVAFAQPPFNEWPREGNLIYLGPDNNPLIELTSLPEVEKDLELSDDQKLQLKIVRDVHLSRAMNAVGHPDLFSGFKGKALIEESKRRLTEIQEREKPRVKEILTAPQFVRLEQITFQYRSTKAFVEQDIATQLELTEEQLEKLIAINMEDQTAERDWRQQTGGKAKRSERAEFLKIHRDYFDRERLSVLAEEQRKKWETMIGAPFTMPEYRGAMMGLGISRPAK